MLLQRKTTCTDTKFTSSYSNFNFLCNWTLSLLPLLLQQADFLLVPGVSTHTHRDIVRYILQFLYSFCTIVCRCLHLRFVHSRPIDKSLHTLSFVQVNFKWIIPTTLLVTCSLRTIFDWSLQFTFIYCDCVFVWFRCSFHFWHPKSRLSPQMRKFIYVQRKYVHIFTMVCRQAFQIKLYTTSK